MTTWWVSYKRRREPGLEHVAVQAETMEEAFELARDAGYAPLGAIGAPPGLEHVFPPIVVDLTDVELPFTEAG